MRESRPPPLHKRTVAFLNVWLRLQGASLFTCCSYSGTSTSEMRCRLRLRTAAPGLNNRLDVVELFTYDTLGGRRTDHCGAVVPVSTE